MGKGYALCKMRRNTKTIVTTNLHDIAKSTSTLGSDADPGLNTVVISSLHKQNLETIKYHQFKLITFIYSYHFSTVFHVLTQILLEQSTAT